VRVQQPIIAEKRKSDRKECVSAALNLSGQRDMPVKGLVKNSSKKR
jgi:hypothetical protein